jgi:hypothetical protein
LQEDTSKDELGKQILQTAREKKPENVRLLVELVREKTQRSEQEIVNRILCLQKNGNIHLASQPTPPPTHLAEHLRSSYARWYWITIALTLATMLAVFIVPENDFPLVYIRYVLGIMFVLLLPGYAFIKALFPQTLPFARALAHSLGTTEKNLDTIERAALSLGMSIALVPMVGLLLNYTPWGISLTPIVLSLTALTWAFATTAILREHHIRTKQEANTAE